MFFFILDIDLISLAFFLISLARGISNLSFKYHFLVLVTFSIFVCNFIHALIFIISYFLFVLDLICSSVFQFLKVEAKIIDFRPFLFLIYAFYATPPSKHCFSMCCILTVIPFKVVFNSPYAFLFDSGLFKSVLCNFQIVGNCPDIVINFQLNSPGIREHTLYDFLNLLKFVLWPII